jgi:cell division protein FtsB
MASTLRSSLSRRLRKGLVVAGLVVLGTWLLFFDSHSLLTRVRWHYELEKLTKENRELLQQSQELEEKLKQGLSDDAVEQIAREEYGMRRPGDTVYRIDATEQGR